MRNRFFLAALLLGVVSGLSGAPTPHFKLTLTRPMLGDGHVRLEPGEYDVAFEPSPMGMPNLVAVFFRGAARVATAAGRLKGAPAGATIGEVSSGHLQGSFDQKYSRKKGSVIAADFEVKVRSERAFYEALLTELETPASDGASKSPAKTPTPKH